MKIHTLAVSGEFRPETQSFRYPGHNDSYDVEQDFYAFLSSHRELLVTTPEEADWCYLPIFWTRWHMAHEYAKTGLEELQAEVTRVLEGIDKAFTVCLYEDGPLVDIGQTVLMTATRKSTTQNAIDIPTLCADHQTFPIAKSYKASFVGRLHTHRFRREMASTLATRSDVLIEDGDFGERHFVETLLASYIALCPTGGSGSFRFYEAMQLGVAPLLISDVDTRPFDLDWGSCSMYLPLPIAIEDMIDWFGPHTLLQMGQRAREIYTEHLAYGKWCPNALRELGTL